MKSNVRENIDYIQVSEDYVDVDEFLEMIRGCKNVKRLANIGYQAGCPMYLVELDDGLDVIWHPSKDAESNTIKLKVTEEKNLEMWYEGIKCPSSTMQEISENIIVSSLVGTNPFRENTIVYEREED